jgi:hypothetical protein
MEGVGALGFGKMRVRASYAILMSFTIKSGEGERTIICFCESAVAISGKISLSSVSYVKLYRTNQGIIIVKVHRTRLPFRHALISIG